MTMDRETADAPVVGSADSEEEQDTRSEDLEEALIQEPVQEGTSTVGAVFLIVNAALGAGLLNFPEQFHKAGGVLTGFLVQLVLLIFILPALVILASTSNIRKSATLQDVMHTVCGVWGQRITSLAVAVYCFGTCITFLIIIGDQFDRLFLSWVGPGFCNDWYMNRDFIVPATSVVLILPLCFTRRIDFLKYASAMGVFTIIYILIVILVEYNSGKYTPGEIRTKPGNFLDVFNVIPVICFGYQCHVSVIPIYSCMKHRNLKHFSLASFTAIAICVITYTVAATIGYLTFGANVAEDILQNYSASSPHVVVALAAMALKTYATYPTLLFCGREGISSLIKDLFISQDSVHKEMVRRYAIAVTWFILSLLLAVVIPDIGAVIDILGSLAAVFIFIFPGLCLLESTYMMNPNAETTASRVKLAVAVGFLTIGAFLFGVVFTQGVFSDLENTGSKNLLCIPS